MPRASGAGSAQMERSPLPLRRYSTEIIFHSARNFLAGPRQRHGQETDSLWNLRATPCLDKEKFSDGSALWLAVKTWRRQFENTPARKASSDR
jgi:hypothetical protein